MDVGEVIVESIAKEADGVIAIQLRRDDGEDFPSWEPGAHLSLDLPNGLLRQYSLCGRLDERTTVTIAVLREPESRGGSAYLHDEVTAGQVLVAHEIRNNFPLELASEYTFLGGGIGITPLIPMIEQAERTGTPWRLVYGGRARSAMAFADALSAYGDRVSLRPQDEHGLLDFAADVTSGLSPGAQVYACGPEPMLTALAAHCRLHRIDLHVEHFTVNEEALRGSGKNLPFTCELNRSGRSVRVEADESIVQALERIGVFARSDCREGTCGSCETAVLAGSVEHRDALLSDEERQESKTMMICVSRAVSDLLIIDM